MVRRLLALVTLLASTALLSGCVVWAGSVSSEQQDVVGKLRISLSFCASGFNDGAGPEEDHPGCPDDGNSNQPAYNSDHQLLFALRVPVGTGTPPEITATPAPAPPAAGTITLRRDASYAAELQSELPAPAGTVWVGYKSTPYAFDDGADDVTAQSAQVDFDLALPPSPDGGPFVGPLAVRPVVGVRDVTEPGIADAPVECGDDPFAISIPNGGVCVDWPPAAQIASDFNFATRDFGIVAGYATVSPGQAIMLPFNVRGVGALPAGLTATLSASTNLPGASVAPSQPTAPLSNGSNTRVTIPVTVPSDTGPGIFDVKLTGRLANGQVRTATAKLTVRDRQDPVLSALAVRPKRFKPATRKRPRRGTTISYALSEPASVRLVVERCSKRARKKGSKKRTGRCLRFRAMRGAFAKTGAPGANSFRFRGRLRGKALKPGPYRLAATATDLAANQAEPVRVRFAVKR